jgi:hypothetical protein
MGMTDRDRPLICWVLMVFLGLSIALMLMGQTLGVFNYEMAERMGLQEKRAEMSDFGVEVNRAFGAADTVVYIPLMLATIIGLWWRRRWAPATLAAVCGMSIYWTATVTFIFLFLPGTAGYSNVPGAEIWLFIATYFLFGSWGLWLVISRGEELVR